LDLYEPFQLENLTANTYAVIAKDGKQAICNSGIIDLGENLLIFDTFNSPIPARELMRAASDLFHKPIKYIVNSHYHTDHTRGNQVFVDSEIISSKYTARFINFLTSWKQFDVSGGRTTCYLLLNSIIRMSLVL